MTELRTHEARGATRCTAEVRADTARGRPTTRCGNRTADPSGVCAKHRRTSAKPRRERPTHEQIIASAEHSGFRVTPDRQFIVQRSVTCQRDHITRNYRFDFTLKVWCQLAHAGHPYGSLFWCDCPCHEKRL